MLTPIEAHFCKWMAADNLKKVKILVLGDRGGLSASRDVSDSLPYSHALSLFRPGRLRRRGEDLTHSPLVLRRGTGKSLLHGGLHSGGQGVRYGISCNSC